MAAKMRSHTHSADERVNPKAIHIINRQTLEHLKALWSHFNNLNIINVDCTL